MAHETQLIPDATIFIQLGLFLASYLTLRILVFGPYLKLIHLRNEKTKGLFEEAAQNRAQSEVLRADYEAYMKTERLRLSQWLDGERKAINDEERAQIAKSRDKVSKEMQVVRDEIAAQVKTASKELSTHVKEYAELISGKIVGHKVSIKPSNAPTENETRMNP